MSRVWLAILLGAIAAIVGILWSQGEACEEAPNPISNPAIQLPDGRSLAAGQVPRGRVVLGQDQSSTTGDCGFE